MSEKKSKKPPKLTGKQVRHLRGLGHHLTPAVMVGREGITKTLIAASEEAILVHELIKVKVQNSSSLDRHEVAEELSQKLKAGVAQILGNTILLFRENRDLKPDKKINLPG